MLSDRKIAKRFVSLGFPSFTYFLRYLRDEENRKISTEKLKRILFEFGIEYPLLSNRRVLKFPRRTYQAHSIDSA